MPSENIPAGNLAASWLAMTLANPGILNSSAKSRTGEVYGEATIAC